MPSVSMAMLAALDIRRCFDNFVEPSRYPRFSISDDLVLTFVNFFLMTFSIRLKMIFRRLKE